MLLRSRIVYPVASPPIENGAVWIHDHRIAAVGEYSHLRAMTLERVTDLGDSLLMPGLVNAHCHLDYTGLVGKIPRPSSFTQWIQQLITLKAGMGFTDFAEAWLQGAGQLAKWGTTTVGDIEAVPELLPDVLNSAPLRVVSFRELITVRSRLNAAELLRHAVAELQRLTPEGDHRVGLSPHAPYSTVPLLIRHAAAASHDLGWQWTMHVAESAEEFDMFHKGSGRMYDWLKGQRDMSDCGKRTPVQWLAEMGVLSPRLLLVHANCLAEGEASLLGQHGVHVAHCPRSHDYFNHPPFPYVQLREAGVNVCLGTDSLASISSTRGATPQLNLFAEMQSFSARHPTLDCEEVVKLCTTNAARALGLERCVGQLAAGGSADLIALPYGGATHPAAEAIVHQRTPPSFCLQQGRIHAP